MPCFSLAGSSALRRRQTDAAAAVHQRGHGVAPLGAGGARGRGSVTDSLCSLSDAAESERGSCSDNLDGISLGSYLDALGDEELEPSLSDGSDPRGSGVARQSSARGDRRVLLLRITNTSVFGFDCLNAS